MGHVESIKTREILLSTLTYTAKPPQHTLQIPFRGGTQSCFMLRIRGGIDRKIWAQANSRDPWLSHNNISQNDSTSFPHNTLIFKD